MPVAHERLQQHRQRAKATPNEFWQHAVQVDGMGKHLARPEPFR
jgi:hypothetical protein